MTLYMAVTPDEYELPIFVESNIEKLSKLTGSHPSSIRSMASRNNRGLTKWGDRTVYKCELYQYQMDRHTSDWKPSYVACKFFDLPWNEAYPGEVKGQMSIEDYPEWMP